MKTSAKWEELYWSDEIETLGELIEKVQKDAWNSAIKAAAESAMPKYHTWNNGEDEIIGVDEESILKLKL